jgi:hypothetical protein
MPKFIKKPIMVEAVQWDGTEENYIELLKLLTGIGGLGETVDGKLSIHYGLDRENILPINLTDWIIKGVKNELYSCKNDKFRATYEKVVNVGR